MPLPKRKSAAYYTILVCLTLIGAAMLLGLLWQPAFSGGYVVVPLRGAQLLFSLWIVVPALLSLLLFGYYTVQTVKRRYPSRPLIGALLFGLLFFLLSFVGPAAFAYSGASSGQSAIRQASSLYVWMVLGARILVVLVILFLLHQWREGNRHRHRTFTGNTS